MSDKVEQDAEEFGKHIKAGGWRMALLVARNVMRGTAGRPPRNPTDPSDSGKVSASEFARMAGLSGHSIVTQYLDAWDRQAPERGLPTADSLDPGDEVKLPDPQSFPFRVTDPEASRAGTKTGVTSHATNTRYEPGGERSGTRTSNRWQGDSSGDGDEPGSVAGGWIRTAAAALDSLASHRSAWQYMTEADYQTLAGLPEVIERIVADVNDRDARLNG